MEYLTAGIILDSSIYHDGLPKHNFIANAEEKVELKIKRG